MQEWGMSIDAEACAYLFQKLNGQPRAIANELEKLVVWKNFAGAITVSDVRACTPTFMSNEFFEPVEAFYAKDVARYVRTLRQHFMLNKEVRSLLVMMQNRNRLCIQLAQLRLPSLSKILLEKCAAKWKAHFGSMEEKSSFCVFSQNPWYLSRIQPNFPLQILLNIQKTLGRIFDQSIVYPKQACAWMESLVQFL
jgi:DNA polymerase-3 subunit delta